MAMATTTTTRGTGCTLLMSHQSGPAAGLGTTGGRSSSIVTRSVASKLETRWAPSDYTCQLGQNNHQMDQVQFGGECGDSHTQSRVRFLGAICHDELPHLLYLAYSSLSFARLHCTRSLSSFVPGFTRVTLLGISNLQIYTSSSPSDITRFLSKST